MYSLTLIFIRFWRALKSSWKEPEFQGLIFLVIAILSAGTVVYHTIEGWSILDSLYFCATTLTTVGYGDFTPTHASTKIFTIIYIFLGVGIIISFINTVARHARKEPFMMQNLAKEGIDSTKNILKNINLTE